MDRSALDFPAPAVLFYKDFTELTEKLSSFPWLFCEHSVKLKMYEQMWGSLFSPRARFRPEGVVARVRPIGGSTMTKKHENKKKNLEKKDIYLLMNQRPRYEMITSFLSHYEKKRY